MSGKGKDFRPICDTWLLAPSKVGYYGAFPNGFLQRARTLLCRMDEPLLHVCSGMVHQYPGYGFGPNDKRLDLDPECHPDFLQDARNQWPLNNGEGWPAILIDPPYTPVDAAHYRVGQDVLPTPTELLKRALEAVAVGGKIGFLHQFHPKLPAKCRLVACIQVVQGQQQQPRCFTVYEREFLPESWMEIV